MTRLSDTGAEVRFNWADGALVIDTNGVRIFDADDHPSLSLDFDNFDHVIAAYHLYFGEVE